MNSELETRWLSSLFTDSCLLFTISCFILASVYAWDLRKLHTGVFYAGQFCISCIFFLPRLWLSYTTREYTNRGEYTNVRIGAFVYLYYSYIRFLDSYISDYFLISSDAQFSLLNCHKAKAQLALDLRAEPGWSAGADGRPNEQECFCHHLNAPGTRCSVKPLRLLLLYRFAALWGSSEDAW